MSENEKDNFVERRQFPRHAVRYIAKVFIDEEMLCGTIIDVSEGGLGILLPKVLPIGFELKLEIRNILSEESSEGLTFKAKIAWMNETESMKGMYRGGLEISEISEKSLDALKDHIQNLADQTE
ncbi:MAG: PilZ domain-containing protein [Candidatus Aureabacteria bacterium]|nr:PilZ domain-containing protein [Candidatus Auribacterota bacterium]